MKGLDEASTPEVFFGTRYITPCILVIVRVHGRLTEDCLGGSTKRGLQRFNFEHNIISGMTEFTLGLQTPPF